MSNKHTPGPWAWFNRCLVTCDANYSIPLNSKVIIYTLDPQALGLTEANSILIASAPELLVACRAAVSMLSSGEALTDVIDILNKVIRKAEGD
jgi:hypothetical protein